MKLKYLSFLFLAIIALGTIGFIARPQNGGLIVHEWGTFTSVQAGDGVPLSWKPLETSRLPRFVHDWKAAGLGRLSSSPFGGFGKGSIITLQRMETPVVYFYTDKERTVDLSVQFPKGLITEWFPQ